MSKQYLTKDRHELLKKELEGLKSTGRLEVAARLKQAKELGDLSENADYQEAREAQSTLERKIREMEEIIRQSIIIEKNAGGSVVKIGSTITVKKDKEVVKYTIVGSNEARPAEGFISNASPMGKVLLGKSIGETAQIETPKGAVKYEILEIN